MRSKYTEKFKSTIMQSYTDGRTVLDISNIHSVPRSTIYYWIKMNRLLRLKNGNQVTVRQYYELLRKKEKIEEENRILHDCGCGLFSTNKIKLAAISKLDEKYSIHSLCRTLNVRRSTYYHYKYRRPNQTVIEKQDLILKPPLKELFEETKGRLGSKKLCILMQKHGYRTSPQRVRRLLSEMNLVCKPRKNHTPYNYSRSSLFRDDLVNREFNPPAPNLIWVSDITYVRVNYKAYYICVVMDLFSRKIIGYNVANNQDTLFVIQTMVSAYKSRFPNRNLIFHSDQGGQYTSAWFRREAKCRSIRSSFSKAGCPYDNAVAESFFNAFKREEVNHHYYRTPDELIASVEEYMDFYNNVRPHDSLGLLTPNEKEALYRNSLKNE